MSSLFSRGVDHSDSLFAGLILINPIREPIAPLSGRPWTRVGQRRCRREANRPMVDLLRHSGTTIVHKDFERRRLSRGLQNDPIRSGVKSCDPIPIPTGEASSLRLVDGQGFRVAHYSSPSIQTTGTSTHNEKHFGVLDFA